MTALPRATFRDPRLMDHRGTATPDAFRVLMAPAITRRTSLPRWLERRLRARLGAEWPARRFAARTFKFRAAEAFAFFIGDDLRGLMDHWGISERHGKPVLALEPYDTAVVVPQLAALESRLRELGAGVRLRAASAHYPTATLRIEIYDASNPERE